MLVQDSETVWIVTKVFTENGVVKYNIRPDAPKAMKEVAQDELTTPL